MRKFKYHIVDIQDSHYEIMKDGNKFNELGQSGWMLINSVKFKNITRYIFAKDEYESNIKEEAK